MLALAFSGIYYLSNIPSKSPAKELLFGAYVALVYNCLHQENKITKLRDQQDHLEFIYRTQNQELKNKKI